MFIPQKIYQSIPQLDLSDVCPAKGLSVYPTVGFIWCLSRKRFISLSHSWILMFSLPMSNTVVILIVCPKLFFYIGCVSNVVHTWFFVDLSMCFITSLARHYFVDFFYSTREYLRICHVLLFLLLRSEYVYDSIAVYNRL